MLKFLGRLVTGLFAGVATIFSGWIVGAVVTAALGGLLTSNGSDDRNISRPANSGIRVYRDPMQNSPEHQMYGRQQMILESQSQNVDPGW